jgi:stage V sporulation protein SpoVS
MLATLALGAALLLQAPAPRPAPSPARAGELRTTAQRRRDLRAAKVATWKANRAREAREAEAWRLYVERVGPVIAAQQRDAFQLEMEARRTAAMQALGAAAMQQAQTDAARYRLQTQQAGIPQVYVPGQGMVPYPGAIGGPTAR